MTFYVDACAPVYFQFHPRSVGRSVGRWVGRSVGRSVGGSVGLSIPALRLGTLVPRQKASATINFG